MARHDLNAYDISTIAYDEKTETLTLLFPSGEVYEYYNVPENIYRDLMIAKRLSRFISRRIKKKFRYLAV